MPVRGSFRLVLSFTLLFLAVGLSTTSAQIVGTWVKAVPADMPGGNTVRASDGATGGWYDGPTSQWTWPHYPNWYAYSGDGGLNAAGEGGTGVDHYSLNYYGENSAPLATLRTTLTSLPGNAYNIYAVYKSIPWASGTSGVKIGLTGESQVIFTDVNGTDTGRMVGTLPVYQALIGQAQAIGGAISVDVDVHSTSSNMRTYYDGLAYEDISAPQPGSASEPDPSYDFKYVTTMPMLSWTTGHLTATHDIYIGTDRDAVRNATRMSIEYWGNYPLYPSSYHPGVLEEATTYYWRIDEVNAEQIAKGPVWRFTTHGLILWLTFDEGQGDTAYDSSGRGNHGTLEGNPKPTWTAGRIDGGLDLSGELDYVEIDDDARVSTNGSDFDDIYSRLNSIAVALWIKVDATPANPSHNWWIATKGYSLGGWALNGWSNYLGFTCAGLTPNSSAYAGGLNLKDGKWHHVVGTYNGSQISLYVDGVLKDSRPVTGGSLRWTHHKVWLGDDSRVQHYGIDGAMDDVRIYSHGLTAAQVSDLYTNSFDSKLAWNPGPHDQAVSVATDVDLSWSAGTDALRHDVYFGTDYDLVNNSGPIILEGDINGNGGVDDEDLTILAQEWLGGAGQSDLDDSGNVNLSDFSYVADDWGQRSAYQGNTSGTSFDPGALGGNTTYYWRIDEVGPSETHKGKVWQFTVAPLLAWNPSPADEDAIADLGADLLWSAGAGAVSHNVYFGTDYQNVNNATPASPQFKENRSTTSYDPGTLALNTTYYWRIDEVTGGGVRKGDVWRFDTTDKWIFYFHGRLDSAERVCAYALQGLVNRDGPRVFYIVKDNWAYQDTDKTWLEYFTTVKGYKFAEIGTLRELIQLARDEGYIAGLVEYGFTSIDGQEKFIAENMAAKDSLLPVTAEMLTYNTDALQLGSGACFAGLPVTDIRGDWATELEAQTWAINNQLPHCVRTGAFSHHLRGGDLESELDNAVMGRYFVYDYDNADDNQWALYQQMSGYLNQPVALFGGVYSEVGAAGARGCSSQGNYIIGGGGTLQNLSFLAQIPVDPDNIVLGVDDNNMTLDPGKYYVTFLMNECDTPKIGMTFMSGDWFHDDRGTASVNWGFGLGLIDYFPVMMEYYQHYATPNDHFFSGALGAGSFWPAYCPNDKLITYAQYVETLMQRTGIIMGENYGGSNIAKFKLFTDYCPSMRLINAERYNNGTNEYLSNGTCLTSCYGATEKPDQAGGLWYAWHQPPNDLGDFEQAELVRRIKAFAQTKSPPYFITVYGRPVEFAPWAQNGLADDPQFIIVGIEDFVDLMEQARP